MRDNLILTISDGLLRNKPIRQIHKEIASIINANKIKDKNVIDFAFKVANNGKKKVSNDDPLLILLFLKNAKIYTKFNHILYENNKQFEAELKDKIIQDTLSNTGNPFVLVSSHGDSAADHKDWQGKLYVIENHDKSLDSFIRSRNIRSFEWVVSKPVWMITRPNCRHYYIQLSYDDVKDKTEEQLINKYRMWSPIGKKKHRTVRLQTGEATLDKYKDRLQFHEKLYKVLKIKEVKNLITKDKLLVDKWQKYLNK